MDLKLSSLVLLAFLSLAMAASVPRQKRQANDSPCPRPPTAPNYSDELYGGQWWEVARIQLPAGAALQEDTYCNGMEFDPNSQEEGIGDLKYYARRGGYSGNWYNVSITLEAREIPGEFEQVWYFEQLGIDGTHDDYYVLYLEEEISLIFACTLDKETGELEDYGIHFQSKTGYIPEDKFDMMFNYAVDELGLNFMDQPLNYDPDPAPCLYYQNNIAP